MVKVLGGVGPPPSMWCGEKRAPLPGSDVRALERLRHWQTAKLVELHLSGICRTNAALVEGKRDEERDLAHQQGTAKLDGTGGEAVRMWVHSGRPRPPRLRAAKAAPYAAELLLSLAASYF